MTTTILRLENMQKVSDLMVHRDCILDLLPKCLDKLSKEDGKYHFEAKENWVESNQINAIRNILFHRQVIDEVCINSNAQSVILELGGGVGFDADLFIRQEAPFRCYILSEISCELLKYGKQVNKLLLNKPILFCGIDAGQIMLDAHQIDTVFSIAALHHFPNVYQSISEIDRVCRPGARIVFGIEPNLLWWLLINRMKFFYRKLFSQKFHSPADEKNEGFVIKDFETVAVRMCWKIEKIIPVWFFAGFLHYGLEFIYRIFRLKKRVVLPVFLEYIFLVSDRFFFLFPGAKKFAWHYTVVYIKADCIQNNDNGAIP